jgi:hypothetical protein
MIIVVCGGGVFVCVCCFTKQAQFVSEGLACVVVFLALSESRTLDPSRNTCS